jgi:hypothetical protein
MQFAHSTRLDFDEGRGDRFDALKLVESAIRTVPPLVRMGGCSSMEKLNGSGTAA